MGTWIYVGSKDIDCPHCQKGIHLDVRVRAKDSKGR